MVKASFIVAGVIASSIPGKGIVVLANIEPTKVLRIGQFHEDLQVFSIKRKYVDFKKGNELVRIMVGDGFPELIPEIETHDYEGGRTTNVTQEYKDDQLSPINLAGILMQAGVEPTDDGFRIFSIEPGSIYDIVGLKDGDVINRVNGWALYDPLRSINILMNLKNETHWVIDATRDGEPISLIVNTSM